MPNQLRCGCVYVAYGFDYWMFAVNSARTLKATNPGLEATLITNVNLPNPQLDGLCLFDQVILHSAEVGTNRLDKLSVDLQSPYEKTLYLDCDTEIWGDLTPMFLLLDRYDLAVRQLSLVTTKKYELLPGLTANDAGFAEWNAGVIFFCKTAAVQAMFRTWRKIFLEEGMRKDQPAFARAIVDTTDLRLLPLSPAWNIKPTADHESNWLDERPADIRILHYRKPHATPSVAFNLYRTFCSIANSINADCSDPGLLQDIARFRMVYAAYDIYLRLFDNRFGRRLLREREHLAFKPLRVLMRLIAMATGKQAFTLGRVRKEDGTDFERVPKRN